MAEGLSYLVTKHPELLVDSRNAGGMCGQVAFAYAAAGEQESARTWNRRTLTHRPLDRRGWPAALTMSRPTSPQTTIAALNTRRRAGGPGAAAGSQWCWACS